MRDPHTVTEDLKLIRLNTHGINEPDGPHAAAYPYRLVVNLRPPELMQVTFIMRYGGSQELVLRGKTREALDGFIARNNLAQNERLRSMTITGPDGTTEEIRR